ncbi:volume-regulated anion channel subunit LRRC8D-like [Bufo gargarizans]|uniref:volume-regulated anion channel subunit LRRC8D-like n=1 Tax=Bufo gargarizans TaxID=30331 RepID=UPI001CF4A688|nr:volume-regulated anion channel subunit LRRC8D-like [Bufo gargarizans]
MLARRGMLTVSEAASLAETQAHFKAMKPWWDVLMDYLLIIMLMTSFFSATLLITMDNVVCMPKTSKLNKNMSNDESDVGMTTQLTSTVPRDMGHLTNLDYQQYRYVSVVCYHKVVPWQSKYFPYLALINTLMLLVSSNFWFKYPKTSSKVEHFLSILRKCFESQWTTKALEETSDQPPPEHSRQKSSSSRSMDISSRTPLLNEVPFSFAPFSLPAILDKKEEQQAKALFEKIRHFRTLAEDSDVVYKVYVSQTFFKVIQVAITLGYSLSLVGSFSFHHICRPGIKNLMGYSMFTCTHNLAFILEKLLLTYIVLVCVYAFLSAYALFWLFTSSLKVYSFDKNSEGPGFSDIPDVKNDFAFMLHMVDRYDTLYSSRFSVFLSAVSEGRLRELALNSEWPSEKLRQMINKDTNGRVELQLSMIPVIPKDVYELREIEVLKLELISSAKVVGAVSQLKSLSELHISHCSVKMDPDAFAFIQERLQVLHVRFTDMEELPSWMYYLKNLSHLILSGNLNCSNNKSIRLQSLRGLSGLRSLSLTSNFSQLPSAVLDVAWQLSKLSIQNGDTELRSLGQLKRMNHLLVLQLCHCKLSRIPGALLDLTSLQCIDLTSNRLRYVDELGNLQRLRSLNILRLSHNAICRLPPSIELLRNLEELSISYNNLENLPVSLFNLVRLRHLDISYNRIRFIPHEVGHLTRLETLAIISNQISSLPRQLFRCSRLRSLHVSSNKLSSLPSEIEKLPLLSSLDLMGNNLTELPREIGNCLQLKKGGLDVEEHVLGTLPPEVRKKYL